MGSYVTSELSIEEAAFIAFLNSAKLKKSFQPDAEIANAVYKLFELGIEPHENVTRKSTLSLTYTMVSVTFTV
jgi:hypothetical protein